VVLEVISQLLPSTLDDKDFVISVSSDGVIYINGNSDAARHLVLKLPTDGSKTGNYTINGTVFTYAASTWTGSTPALGLSARTPTYNGALSGLSHSTSSLTDGSRSYSITKQTI